MTDWIKEQKRFNKINLKKRMTVDEYAVKYNLPKAAAHKNIRVKKASQKRSIFQEKKENELIKKKPN